MLFGSIKDLGLSAWLFTLCASWKHWLDACWSMSAMRTHCQMQWKSMCCYKYNRMADDCFVLLSMHRQHNAGQCICKWPFCRPWHAIYIGWYAKKHTMTSIVESARAHTKRPDDERITVASGIDICRRLFAYARNWHWHENQPCLLTYSIDSLTQLTRLCSWWVYATCARDTTCRSLWMAFRSR